MQKTEKNDRIISVIRCALLGIGFFSVSGAAFAVSLSTSTSFPLGPGGRVAGGCHSVHGDIVTTEQLQNFQQNIVQVTKEVGTMFNTGQNQQMAANIQQRSQKLQELVHAESQIGAAKAQNKYIRETTGPNASASACQQISGASDTLNGIVASQATAAQITASALSAEQPVSSPMTAVQDLAKASAPTLSASSLIPMGDTAATASAMSAYIGNVVMPVKPQKITAAAESTPAGSQYQALKHVMDARSSLATVTLGDIAKVNLPDTNDALAKLYWQKAGISGPIPGDSNGKVSQNGLLDAMSYRYLVGSYAIGGSQSNGNHGDAWMLRQYAIEMSGELHAELEEENFLEHAVALQAAMLSGKLQKNMGSLNGDRGAAMEQAARNSSGSSTSSTQ